MKTHQPTPLISVEDALQIILAQITPTPAEEIALTEAFGRVLAQAVVSPLNVPPFANSAMDGYAVVAADTQPACPDRPVRLAVTANIPAGSAPQEPLTPGSAARIMTGAPMPVGATAVVRFEDTSEYLPTLPNMAPAADEVLIYQPAAPGDNVRAAGEDIKQGQTVLAAGHRLRPQDVGVLAAIGQARLMAHRRPRAAILATGDELVDVAEPLPPGKIRNSNEYTQAAMVQKYGGQPVRLGIARDTVEHLTAKIRHGLAQNVDLFLTSAGVSVGDFDMVKNVLAAEGDMQFWQVGIKPGKPLAFGLLQHGDRPVPLIGLPGNPVASMVAFEVFARPAILKLGGHLSYEKNSLLATLDEEVTNSGRRHYMRGFVYQKDGHYRVTTRGSNVQVQGSGILSSMVWANCLAVVPENVTHLPAGTAIETWILD